MRHKNVFLKLVLLTLFLIQTAVSVEISELRLALIWNINTRNYSAPIGWDVGDASGAAPEIAKAQMKLLLSSYTDKITFDQSNPLDVSGIPDVLRDNSGINGALHNVRIYSWADAPLSLDMIKGDFDGEKPNAIIYINGGAEWTSSNGDDGGLYDLLLDAANDDIGIMTIGDASVTDAKNIDPNKTAFPIMGVQKTYRFKAFGKPISTNPHEQGDIIKEFDFLSENDIKDANGDVIWEMADTVQLHSEIDWSSEGNSRYFITLVNPVGNLAAGEIIYECKGTVGDKLPAPTINKTIYSDPSAILHAYGEWSINAKAVEVIDNDTYAPEMADGIYNNHDVILIAKNNSVYVARATWGANLYVNGDILAARGSELPGVKNVGTFKKITISDYNGNPIEIDGFVLDQDYIVDAPNDENGGAVDKILVLEAGDTIRSATKDADNGLGNDWDTYQSGTYIGTYRAGGYKNLKIDLNDAEGVFSDVFPHLKTSGINELKFRPWSKNGRIQADADVWAVNEKLKPKSFDKIVSDGFDNTAYYTAYLGDQKAGVDGNPHFVKPPETRNDFNKTADAMRNDSLGYDKDGKLYHAISAIQNNHRRMVMLGFQPTYLEGGDIIDSLLSDATKWIGVDDYKLPTPAIIPTYGGSDLLPADQQKVHTDIDEIRFEIDFSKNGPTLKSSEFELAVTVNYAGNSYDFKKVFAAADRKVIEKHTIKLSDQIAVDPTKINDTLISITAVAKPTSTTAPFDKSDDEKADLRLKKLVAEFGNSSADLGFNGSFDELLKVESDVYTDAVAGANVVYIAEDALGSTGEVTEASPFTLTMNKTTKVTFHGEKSGYLNSETLVRNYNREDLQLPKPVIDPDGATITAQEDYYFGADAVFNFDLEEHLVSGVAIGPDDYNISYTLYGASVKVEDVLDEVGDVTLPLTKIDEMIAAGATGFDIQASTIPDKNDAWVASGDVTEQYKFRNVTLVGEIITTDPTALEIELNVKVFDNEYSTPKELTDGEITYSIGGTTYTKNSGENFKVPNGSVLNVTGSRSGYISAKKSFPFVQGSYVTVTPDSTAFGDLITLELTGNVLPYNVVIKNYKGDVVLDKEFTSDFVNTVDITDALLNDQLASGDEENVEVVVSVDKTADIDPFVDTVNYTHRRLPKVTASPVDDDANKTPSSYIFDGADAEITLSLEKSVEASDYWIDYSLGDGTIGKLNQSGEKITIPLASVVSLINNGKTDISLDAQAQAERTEQSNSWMHGEEMEKQTYEFRQLTTRVERVGGGSGSGFDNNGLTLKFYAVDVKDNDREVGGDIITVHYDFNDGTGEKSMTLASGATYTWNKDVKVYATSAKEGWIKSTATDSEQFYRIVDLSEGASYFDRDGNGTIDSGWIIVDTLIAPTSIICRDPFGSTEYTIDGTDLNLVGNRISFGFPTGSDFVFGTEFDVNNYITISGANYNGSSEVSVSDSVAPVIARASVMPADPTEEGAFDLLYVEFSEDMDKESLKSASPFHLYRGSNSSTRQPVVNNAVEPELVSGTIFDGMYKFEIVNWGSGITYPVSKDSLYINKDASVSDAKGAAQLVDLNRKVELVVEPKPVDLDFIWIWKSSEMKDIWGNGVSLIGSDGDNPSLMVADPGIIMILDPKSELGVDQLAEVEVKVSIFDQLGNVVVSGESEAYSFIDQNNLQAGVAKYFKTFEDGSTGDQTATVLFWPALNSEGRRVGSGTYKVYIQAKWPGDVSNEVTALIKVQPKETTKK